VCDLGAIVRLACQWVGAAAKPYRHHDSTIRARARIGWSNNRSWMISVYQAGEQVSAGRAKLWLRACR